MGNITGNGTRDNTRINLFVCDFKKQNDQLHEKVGLGYKEGYEIIVLCRE